MIIVIQIFYPTGAQKISPTFAGLGDNWGGTLPGLDEALGTSVCVCFSRASSSTSGLHSLLLFLLARWVNPPPPHHSIPLNNRPRSSQIVFRGDAVCPIGGTHVPIRHLQTGSQNAHFSIVAPNNGFPKIIIVLYHSPFPCFMRPSTHVPTNVIGHPPSI